MVTRSIQQTYEIYPGRGFPGDVARPNEPMRIDSGTLHVPAGATRMPRPGDAVYYDTAENKWAIPTDAAQSLLVAGILHYRKDEVANTSDIVEFRDDAEIEVARFGTFWVVSGGAIEYDQLIQWDRSDFQWDGIPVAAAPTDVAGVLAILHRVPIVCASRAGASAAGEIIEAHIGSRVRG